jgi:hypothetical protein
VHGGEGLNMADLASKLQAKGKRKRKREKKKGENEEGGGGGGGGGKKRDERRRLSSPLFLQQFSARKLKESWRRKDQALQREREELSLLLLGPLLLPYFLILYVHIIVIP